MHAVAAWAARREILNLLESGVDPKTLIDLLKDGREEGPKLLDATGSPRSLSPRSKSPRSKDSIDSRWEDPPSNTESRRFKSSSSTPMSSARSVEAKGPANFGGLEFGRKALPPPEQLEKDVKPRRRSRASTISPDRNESCRGRRGGLGGEVAGKRKGSAYEFGIRPVQDPNAVKRHRARGTCKVPEARLGEL